MQLEMGFEMGKKLAAQQTLEERFGIIHAKSFGIIHAFSMISSVRPLF